MQQSKFSPKRQNDEKSESPSPNEKKNKTYEKFRTRSFLAKLSYYQSKFKFTENELLMIKKR